MNGIVVLDPMSLSVFFLFFLSYFLYCVNAAWSVLMSFCVCVTKCSTASLVKGFHLSFLKAGS